MENVILVVVLLLILVPAVLYLIKAKRRGQHCIGCPNGGSCHGQCCAGCQGDCGGGCKESRKKSVVREKEW